MEAIRVKIIKCSSESYWYKDKIGKEFDVVEGHAIGKYALLGFRKYIDIEDCVVIQEKPYPKMMYVWDEGDPEGVKAKMLVLGKFNNLYACTNEDETEFRITSCITVDFYTYAEDLPERTKLTKQEIADKFGVDVELLDIEL